MAIEPSALASALDASGEANSVNASELSDGTPVLTAEVKIEDFVTTLRIVLAAPFPARLPIILVDDTSILRQMPHLDDDGQICFTAPEGTLLNFRRPADLVIESVRRAKGVLADGLAGAYGDDEYCQEFEAHWRNGKDGDVRSTVVPGESVREIIGLESNEQLILASNEAEFESFQNGPRSPATRRCGLFIPLESASALTPIPEPLDITALRKVIWSSLSPANTERLRRSLRHRKKQTDYVVIQVPRAEGPVLVGLLLEDMGKTHALLECGDAATVRRLLLTRLDRDYLHERSGSSTALMDRSVCLVGCGAVGSRILDGLIHSGISNLLLIDPDRLSSDNTYRHLLGRKYWERGKAEALAGWAQENIPYIRVKPYQMRFDEVLGKVPKADLADLDMIIFATGDESAELQANASLAGRSRPPMIFTWLEPLGLGGHVLLSVPDSAGCFECLHTDSGGRFVENRAAYAAEGQNFTRDLRGCGSPFTPFSNLHAERTAVLACETALGYLQGSLRTPLIRSWKGESLMFERLGYRLSQRYISAEDSDEVEDFKSPMCPVCGRGRVFGV